MKKSQKLFIYAAAVLCFTPLAALAGEANYDICSISEAKNVFKNFQIVVDNGQAQVHGAVFNKCLEYSKEELNKLRESDPSLAEALKGEEFGILPWSGNNKDSAGNVVSVVGYRIHDPKGLVRWCMTESQDKECSKTRPCTILPELAGPKTTTVHSNVALVCEDPSDSLHPYKADYVRDESGTPLVIKDAKDLDNERRAAAKAKADRARAKRQAEIDQNLANVQNCRGDKLDVAYAALDNLVNMGDDAADESKIAELKKKLELAELAKIECAAVGKSMGSESCAGVKEVDKAGLEEVSDQALSFWGQHQSDAIKGRLMQLAFEMAKKKIQPDNEEGSVKNSDFKAADKILKAYKEALSLAPADKKKVSGWQEDLKLAKLENNLANGTQGNMGLFYDTMNLQRRFAQNVAKACRGRSEAAQESCADAQTRLTQVGRMWQNAQLTDMQNVRMMQMAYSQQQSWAQRMMNPMSMMGGMGNMGGMGSMYNPMMYSNPYSYNNPMFANRMFGMGGMGNMGMMGNLGMMGSNPMMGGMYGNMFGVNSIYGSYGSGGNSNSGSLYNPM